MAVCHAKTGEGGSPLICFGFAGDLFFRVKGGGVVENVYFCKKINVMPQISSFYGIVIFMNFTDHSPAHFHAWYGEYKVTVGIRDGVVTGKMPGRALRMILEWLELHRDELISDWEKAQTGSPLDRIEPLN